MEVKDFLSRVPARVEDEAETRRGETLLGRELASPEENMAQEAGLLGRNVVEGGEMILGNDQDVGGGLGLMSSKARMRSSS
jgi:hypothetical protein